VAGMGPVTIGFCTACASNELNNETKHTVELIRIDSMNLLARRLQKYKLGISCSLTELAAGLAHFGVLHGVIGGQGLNL